MMSLVHYNLTHKIEVFYTRANHGSQADARNELVDNMQGDWLFMIDTDMSFEPDTFEKILKLAQENNLEVVSGLYYQRQSPYHPVAYTLKDGKYYSWDPKEIKDLDLVPSMGVGGGCLLVKSTVFKRIKEELGEKPFSVIPPLSEDLSFCKRLEKLDIQPYIAVNIEVGHLALKEVTRSDFLRRKDGK